MRSELEVHSVTVGASGHLSCQFEFDAPLSFVLDLGGGGSLPNEVAEGALQIDYFFICKENSSHFGSSPRPNNPSFHRAQFRHPPNPKWY